MGIILNKRGLLNARTAIFRVDAGPGIGMGHFMRCRTLACEMIARGWVVFFIGHGLPVCCAKNSHNGVVGNINFIETDFFQNSRDDVINLLDILQKRFGWNLDCLIVDTYRYSRDDFAFLQRFSVHRLAVVVIDDLANRDTPAQAVINPNPMFSSEPYDRQHIPVVLCGEKYTLVRPEIVSLAGRVYDNSGPLMISLGGGDVVRPMMKLLTAIPEGFKRRICISVSPDCPLQEIESWIARDPVQRFLNTDIDKFPELLASSSLAITGGGTTLWEVYCLGMPSLGLIWVDNQKHTSVIIKEQATSFMVDLVTQINFELNSEWLDSGLKSLSKQLGSHNAVRSMQEEAFLAGSLIKKEKTSLVAESVDMINSDFIALILAKLDEEPDFWQNMIERQHGLIDGQGARRCVEILETLAWREVTLFEADWRRIYENWQV